MKVIKFIFNRAALITLILLVQFVFVLFSVFYLTEYFWSYYFVLEIISILFALGILNRDADPSTKLPWIIIILLTPPFGLVIYLMFKTNNPIRKHLNMAKKLEAEIKFNSKTDADALKKLKRQPFAAVSQAKYLQGNNLFPVYTNTKTTFFSSGEEFFEEYLKQLSKAKKFIFMEYFILQQGKMWREIEKVLIEKSKNGVEIVIMYDDIGSIYKLPYNFNKKLMQKTNIKVVKFNRFRPIISALHNNRDHRKLTIIDGKVAFTGGINIADEYINQKVLFGHWKDSAIMIEGKAVDTFTNEFLKLYHINGAEINKTENYFPVHKDFETEGFVQPFFDGPSPIYKDKIGENAYINMINQAKNYLYITTPYLIIDYTFMSALKLAAKRGVDVRIITPHVPDKKIIFMQTRSSYKTLLESGVKIYEYVPGFMHSKTIISDDQFAIVGTFNIDYRSFIHHFENGVWLYKTSSIKEIKKDIDKTIEKCKEIDFGNYGFNFFVRLSSNLLAIFSPLL